MSDDPNHWERFDAEGDGLPLTRVQLDDMQTEAPWCESCGEHRIPIMLFARCCEDTAMHVSYCIGMLKITCAGCEQPIAEIAVEAGQAPETP